MAKFDYMRFHGGYYGDELVVHAKKHTKEQAKDIFVQEHNDLLIKYRRPTDDDIYESFVRYVPSTPHALTHEIGEGGCYVHCENSNGSFPVWVFRIKEMREEQP